VRDVKWPCHWREKGRKIKPLVVCLLSVRGSAALGPGMAGRWAGDDDLHSTSAALGPGMISKLLQRPLLQQKQ